MTREGLAGWQESQRALVAREMLDNNEWIVPTRNHQPYLAKPPMIYWCQMAIASVRGSRVTEFDLRLTVALASWLGVIATYVAAGRMLRDPRTPARFARAPALWASLGLATGILYLRSSRTGELDILLAPSVTLAVWSVFEAWTASARTNRAHWGWLALASFAAAIAALTKGPPAIAIVAIGAYGSIIAYESLLVDRAKAPPASLRFQPEHVVASLLFAFIIVWKVRSFSELFNVLILALSAAFTAWIVLRIVRPAAVRRWFKVLTTTHPVLVLGIAVGALWGWGRLAAAEIGTVAVHSTAGEEMADNLLLFVTDSAARNLGFILYGLGFASCFGLFGIARLMDKRHETTRGQCVALAWFVGGFVLLSLAGKGVARYLTPTWPALAMLSAIGITHLLATMPEHVRRRNARLIIAIFLVTAFAQIYWYTTGRPKYYPGRSPREFARELIARGADPSRIGSWAFDDPALEFYLENPVVEWGDGRRHAPIARLFDEMGESDRPYIMLVREENEQLRKQHASFFDAMHEQGWAAEPLLLRAPYVRYQTQSRVQVLQILPSAPSDSLETPTNSTDDTSQSSG